MFARYDESDRRAEAHVSGIGGEKGDRYEPVSATEYTEDRFVTDFDDNKCEHFENVRLEKEEDRMFVEVDRRRVELEEHRLSTSGHEAVLSGKLGGEADFKVEFDGDRESVRFGRGYPVEGMRVEGDELVVAYSQSRNERHEHRVHLEHLEEPERPSLGQFDEPEMREHVRMVEKPEGVEGLHQFDVDEAAHDEIKKLLADAEERGENEYGHMKAEISERLVPNMLELAGWESIKWHPFNETEKEGSTANGSDWLLRTPDGKVVLAEIKWYENRGEAIRKATTQVADDFKDHQDDPDLKLEGAYIAIMDYNEDNEDDSPVKIHVLRVRTQEELK